VVAVADPDGGNALVAGVAGEVTVALVLVGRTGQRRTVELVLAERTVGVLVAALGRVDAAVGHGAVAAALELRRQTRVAVAVGLVRVVAAVGVAVAQQRRVDAVAVGALELARHARERPAVGRLVRTVAAVVLIATPIPFIPLLLGRDPLLRWGSKPFWVVTPHDTMVSNLIWVVTPFNDGVLNLFLGRDPL